MLQRTMILAFSGILATGAIAYLVISGQDDATPAAAVTQMPIVSVALPENLSGPAEQGKSVFEDNCAACHGVNAAGNDGFGPPLVHVIYEPNHHSDDSFRLAAMRGVRAHHWPFGNMPAQPHVGADEVESIIAYVRELQQANGIN